MPEFFNQIIVERDLSPFTVHLSQLTDRENSFRWNVSCQCFKLGVIKMEVGSRNTTRAKEIRSVWNDFAAEKVRARELRMQKCRRVQIRFSRIVIFQGNL